MYLFTLLYRVSLEMLEKNTMNFFHYDIKKKC